MSALQRTIIGFIVMGLGAMAAAPFRESISPADAPATPSSSSDVVWRRPDALLRLPTPSEVETPHPTAPRQRSTLQIPTIAAADPVETSPEPMAEAFEKIKHVPPSRPGPEDAAGVPAHFTDTPPRAEMRHRIVDGDTLELLAERYLKSRRRWTEIFAANRESLVSPDVLPIGTELKIPVE